MTALYRALWVAGLLLLGGGVVTGVVVAWNEFGGPPPVPLAALIDPHLEEAERLIAEGDYDRAIRQLEISTRLREGEAGVGNRLLARALLARHGDGDAQAAIVRLRAAIEADPDVADAHNDLGVAYARSGKLDEAIAAVRRALQLDPAHAGALQNLQLMERDAAVADAATPARGALAVGRRAVRSFYRGELDRLRAAFTESLDAQLDYEQLEAMRVTIFRQLGAESALLDEGVEERGGAELYRRRARFERHDGEVDVLVKIVDGERVDGLQFAPAGG